MRIILALLTLVSSSLLALTSGNPAEPSLILDGCFFKSPPATFKVGFEETVAFNKNLKLENSLGSIDNFSLLTQQGTLTLNLYQKAEIQAAVGSSSAYFSNIAQAASHKITYQTSNHLSYSASAKAILFQKNQLSLAVNAIYFQTNPCMGWNTLNGTPYSSAKGLRYKEWQAGIGVAYKIDFMIPYFVLSYNNTFAKVRDSANSFSMQGQTPINLAVGCSLTKGKIFDLNLEFRFFSETALTVSGNIGF